MTEEHDHDFSIWYEFTSNVKFCSVKGCKAVIIDRGVYVPERRK